MRERPLRWKMLYGLQFLFPEIAVRQLMAEYNVPEQAIPALAIFAQKKYEQQQKQAADLARRGFLEHQKGQ